jgi:hypothetical protein
MHGSQLRQFAATPFSGRFACAKNLRHFPHSANIRGSLAANDGYEPG